MSRWAGLGLVGVLVSLSARADAPAWDIVVMMSTKIGEESYTSYKPGTHVFTPASIKDPKFFKAPVGNLMCWLSRNATASFLRCWPDVVPRSKINGIDHLTSAARVNCLDKDGETDHITYCKGSLPGTVTWGETRQFECVEIDIMCMAAGTITSLTNPPDK